MLSGAHMSKQGKIGKHYRMTGIIGMCKNSWKMYLREHLVQMGSIYFRKRNTFWFPFS